MACYYASSMSASTTATQDAPVSTAQQERKIPPTHVVDPVTGKLKFAKGNKCGKGGNPLQQRSLKLRAALLSAVTTEDIQEIMFNLVEAAKNGNITAAREVLDRTIGKSDESMVVKKLEELEERFLEQEESNEAP